MTGWYANALELERLRADRKEALELLGQIILDPERHVALGDGFRKLPGPTSTCLECEEPWPCSTERAAQLLDRCQ